MKRLLAFPCNAETARNFLRRVRLRNPDALVLKKQLPALGELLRNGGVSRIFAMDEAFYGRITSAESERVLRELRAAGYAAALFPMNNCYANPALLLSLIAAEVRAVNPHSRGRVEMGLALPAGLARGSRRKGLAVPPGLLGTIKRRLRRVLTDAAPGPAAETGERPTSGLIEDSPYDYEILSRYVHAAGCCRGAVLEIGCGLGYGAFCMRRIAPGIERLTAVDHDAQAIAAARSAWGRDAAVDFQLIGGDRLPFDDAVFDSVVLFEVIEHLRRPRRLISEIRRVLKRGGLLVGSTPNHELFPYRVNKGRGTGDARRLREAGVWPWHLQEFDEGSLRRLLRGSGFGPVRFKYPTFIKGMDILRGLAKLPFARKAAYLERNLHWAVEDFAALDAYVPMFSGNSFIFEARGN